MRDREMREFWDARAAENAYYYVDNRLSYADPDLDAFWASGAEMLDAILGDLGLEPTGEEHVVEIGCGVGRVTRVLAERCRRVTAFDVSGEMIAQARELNAGLDNVDWVVGDGTSLKELADGAADACFSSVVFQHIPDPEITLAYVAEAGRVLGAGGWAALQVSNDPGIHAKRPLAERLRAVVPAVLGRGHRGQAHRAWLGSAVDLGRLELRARESGLELERVEGAGTQYCHVLARKPG
jgi:SAM-dependent methyltransferase